MASQALAPLRRRGTVAQRERRRRRRFKRAETKWLRRMLRQAQIDAGYILAGVLTPEEVRQSRFGGTDYDPGAY